MTTVGAAKHAEVTAREAEVLALIARHLTNAQIGDALWPAGLPLPADPDSQARRRVLPGPSTTPLAGQCRSVNA
jgi:hypothetical protein